MKKHKHFHGRLFVTLLLMIVGSVFIVGCELPNDQSDASHSDDAAPDYEMVFNTSVVKRIDLVFEPDDWQAMLDHMTQIVGPFGEGMNFPSGSPDGDDGPPGQMPDGFELPPEMFDACEGLDAGDTCSFTVMGVSRDGACMQNPNLGDGMICMPSSAGGAGAELPGADDGSPGQMPGGGEIPPEVFDACEGLNADDACSFEIGGMSQEGTCSKFPQFGDELICASTRGSDLIQEDPIYKPCTVKFRGKTWQNVGMRFKGNSSLLFTWSMGSYKLPFRLDFDKYEDDHPEIKNQRFYGFEKLTFSSGLSDNSMIRELVASAIFRDAGVPAAKSAFYRVYVNYGQGPKYFGLYTMLEDPNGPMLGAQFEKSGGNLYKPDGGGATFASFDEKSFVKKTNEKEADWSDVKALYDALHADREDAAAWRSELESVFDVDGFLQYLGINNFVVNWDSYGKMPHNYYLYFDSGMLNWIPWDHNMTWMDRPAMGFGGDVPESPDLSHIGEEWPLIRYLLDDPVYFSRYLFFVNETLTGVFETERMTQHFESAFNLVKPHVVGLFGEKEGYTLQQNSSDFGDSLQILLDFAENRRVISKQLLSDKAYSPATVVINEIYYNPPPEQDDDYEFIELTNIGDNTVDLSGYKFSGIDFAFPADTAIAPGEYLLICKNAELYADKAAQVFQWDAGKLSNKGERLSLMDTNDNIVDYIKYNDGFNWPEKADGEGFSLELHNSTLVNSMAENWQAVTLGGTPGRANGSK